MPDAEALFEFCRQKKLSQYDIKDKDWAEEMLWWAVENGRVLSSVVTDEAVIPDSLIIKGLDKGYSSVFTEEIVNTHPNIADEHYVNFIRQTSHASDIFNTVRTFVTRCRRLMTHDIILELALVTPSFIFMANGRNIKFTENELLRVGDRYFEHEDTRWFLDWRNDFPMSRHHWDCVMNSKHGISPYLMNRKDRPHDVFMKWCENSLPDELKDMKNVTAQDIIDCLATKDDQYAHELLSDGKLECIFDVIKLDPSLIRYVKKPTVRMCKAVIDQDPKNIRFMHTKSPNVYKYALEKDDSVREFVPSWYFAPKKPKFPAPWYLCKFDCNVCGEDSVCYFKLVRGADMNGFLAKKFTVNFGNLHDDEKKRVRDCVRYDALTDEQYELIKKLDICSYRSGFYDFN